ncbi:helix-turn-helix domain-containing protein [Aquimarina sp. 2304DJ70-9]|uniref:helix-turn-helix domain-containing protein n=1 Tax=Aquimarina penaris TaxID=3231044 RepID=UPI0034626DCD
MILVYNKIFLLDKVVFGQVIAKPTTRTAATTLEEAYLLHVKEGECWVFSESDKLFIGKGESVVLQGMYVGNMIPDMKTGMFEALSVRFHPEILKYVSQNDLSLFSWNKNQKMLQTTAKLEGSFLIDSYFEQIQYYFKNRHLITEEILGLKIKEMVLLLLQTKQADKVKQILQQLFDPGTKSFREVIETHIYSDLTLRELSHLTNLSLSSFKRHFEKEYHTTPASHLWKKRLNKAKHLLENSNDSISEIAFKCGFKTTSHFSKKFKKSFGETPTSFKLNLTEHKLNTTE